MSKYTTELRYIVESGYDLGLKDYEIFSEEYRTKLNNKILNHYYFHEIGYETANRFKWELNNLMNEIMPYYNQLLKSELLEINPLLTFERKSDASKDIGTTAQEDANTSSVKTLDNTTTQNATNQSDLSNTSKGNTSEDESSLSDAKQKSKIKNNKNVNGENSTSDEEVYSDTPQGLLTDGGIDANKYATNATLKDNKNKMVENENSSSDEDVNKSETSTNTKNTTTDATSSSSSTSSADSSTTVDTDETMTNETKKTNLTNTNETTVVTENGFEIPLSELVLKYRETFMNVDLEIIKELKQLFMMIY